MFDFGKMFLKGIKGFFIGLLATVALAIAAALTNYNPNVCSSTVTENCTPVFMMTIYLSVIPVVTGALHAFVNWLKNKDK